MNKFLYVFFAFAFLYISFSIGRKFEQDRIPVYQESKQICTQCIGEAEVVKTKLDTAVAVYDELMLEIQQAEKSCKGTEI